MGDLENWYSYVQRIWKVDVKSNLKYLVDIIIKAGMAQGYITEDPKPKIEMNPLWSLSEAEQATVDQTKGGHRADEGYHPSTLCGYASYRSR